jgi:hypothetical protein
VCNPRRIILPRPRHVVVGGGDTAIEGATFLARFAHSVTVVQRRSAPCASKVMQNRSFADDKISFAFDSEIAGIRETNGMLGGVVLREVFSGATRDLDVGSERVGHLVCLVSRYSLLLWSPKQLENARPTMLWLQICRARNDVEVHVCEAFGFGKLDDVGLGATSHAPESPGELDLPHSQGRCLSVGEVMNCGNVASRQQHQPAGHCRVEGVGHSPVLVRRHALAWWKIVELGFLAACVAVGSRHELRS